MGGRGRTRDCSVPGVPFQLGEGLLAVVSPREVAQRLDTEEG